MVSEMESLDSAKEAMSKAAKKSWEAGIISWIVVIMVTGAGWLVYKDHSTLVHTLQVDQEILKDLSARMVVIDEKMVIIDEGRLEAARVAEEHRERIVIVLEKQLELSGQFFKRSESDLNR